MACPDRWSVGPPTRARTDRVFAKHHVLLMPGIQDAFDVIFHRERAGGFEGMIVGCNGPSHPDLDGRTGCAWQEECTMRWRGRKMNDELKLKSRILSKQAHGPLLCCSLMATRSQKLRLPNRPPTPCDNTSHRACRMWSASSSHRRARKPG